TKLSFDYCRTTPAGAGAQKPAQAAVTGREPAGLGRLGGASRKRGPWAPLCEGRGRSTWQPRAAGSSDVRLAAGSPRCGPHPFPPGGTRLLSTLAGLFPGSPSSPTPPARAAVPIGRALPSLPHPPRVYALSPPPPVTSSSSPVGPSAPLHSPPQFADFRPPSAWSSRAAASGVIFSPTLVGVGEDFYRKEIEVDSSPSVLEILDTAGTEQFASMRDLYIKNGQGFILVYSLVNQQSFQDIKPMRDQIVRVKRYEKVPLILVGNKVDLEPEREVMSSEGRALAQEWGCPFMETSAKSKSMVDELFAEIVRQMNYSSLPEKQDQCCTTCVVQ
uniref:RAP2C, member of RAS oncogene family n=1 Tax=Callithrix jacchus TaxID=9483 RepID=A0A8I3WZ23_CALJA